MSDRPSPAAHDLRRHRDPLRLDVTPSTLARYRPSFVVTQQHGLPCRCTCYMLNGPDVGCLRRCHTTLNTMTLDISVEIGSVHNANLGRCLDTPQREIPFSWLGAYPRSQYDGSLDGSEACPEKAPLPHHVLPLAPNSSQTRVRGL